MQTQNPAVLQEAAKLLRSEIKRLQKVNSSTQRSGFDEVFDALRRDAMSGRHVSPSEHSMGAATMGVNRGKNRYCDVLPYDANRVVLQCSRRSKGDGADYINASFIYGTFQKDGSRQTAKAEGGIGQSLPQYIATQGPLENTIASFWEMALQQKVLAVLMLTREVEGSKLKCNHYFPHEAGTTEEYGSVKVTTLSVRAVDAVEGSTTTSGRHSGGSAGDAQQGPPTLQRTLRVEDSRTMASWEVEHFQYSDWPDHGVPHSTGHIRQLIRFIRDSPQLSPGPFIVHCSAGIGRTGTYCTIDYTVRRLLGGDVSAVDIPGTIAFLRTQREGMVQTRDQFRFCYFAVLEELEELLSHKTAP